MSNKKSQVLGMNFGAARGRLDRDIMFHLAVQLGHKCHRCGRELVREGFSVDHKENWSLAENPLEAFFDINNIAFSHMYCNTKEMHERRSAAVDHGKYMYDKHGCRCDVCKKAKSEAVPYNKEKRRARYVKYGT